MTRCSCALYEITISLPLFFFFFPKVNHILTQLWSWLQQILRTATQYLKKKWNKKNQSPRNTCFGQNSTHDSKNKVTERRINTYCAQKIRKWNKHILKNSSVRSSTAYSHKTIYFFNRCLSEGPRSLGEGPHYTLERSLVYYSTRAHTYMHTYKHTRGDCGVSNPADVHVNGVWEET